jgi:hypothetical protein
MKFTKIIRQNTTMKQAVSDGKTAYLSGLLSCLQNTSELRDILKDLEKVITNGASPITNELGYYDEGYGFIEHDAFIPNLPYVEISDQANLYFLLCHQEISILYYKNEIMITLTTAEVLKLFNSWLFFLESD